MKKIAWTMLTALLLTLLSPFSCLVSAEQTLPPLWDGSVADGFAGGDGTESNPFLIETAAQFAYFTHIVNQGNGFVDKHIRLCADLRLNDETFTFEPDTGLVKVTDGINTAYFGTDKKGNADGNNRTFDNNSSTLFQWYNADGKKIQNYPGQLHSQAPIGMVDQCFFRGHFDGGDHTISGVFISGYTQDVGLFANLAADLTNGILEHLHVKQSLVAGQESVGGLVGTTTGISSSTIRCCSFDGVVVGKTDVGGILGKISKTPQLSLCENNGTIVGNNSVGGILGYGENVQECLNNGTIYGGDYTGGIVGRSGNTSSGSHFIPGIYRCTNNGNVCGKNHVGGIVGNNSRDLQYCHNTGAVVGEGYYVGGIAGQSQTFHQIEQCQNIGPQVNGGDYTGGICGEGNANQCYNSADVIGGYSVGGICGEGVARNSKNIGFITGTSNVGGVVGTGNVAACCNYGDVSGKQTIGGVIGNINEIARLCYNRASVTATQGSAGGIAGSSQAELSDCYNVGKITGFSGSGRGVGALVGRGTNVFSTLKIKNAYYLEGCATDQYDKVQSGIGTISEEEGADIEVIACSAEEMMKIETYSTFDFKLTWQEHREDFPTLQILKTPHEVVKTEDEKYLHNKATCLDGAQYRKSCSCGAVLDGFFTIGKKTAHMFGDWTTNDTDHRRVCTVCRSEFEEQTHAFDTQEVVITETTSEVVMRCSVCRHTIHLPFELDRTPSEEISLTQTPTKTGFSLDIRFVLLLLAGVVLGAMGTYGVSIVQKTRKNIQKKPRSENFI